MKRKRQIDEEKEIGGWRKRDRWIEEKRQIDVKKRNDKKES